MSQVTINIEHQNMTVSEMRKHLATVLSRLRGDQTVSFSFTARLDNYKPRPQICLRCRIGIDHDGDGHCGVCARRSDAEAASLAAGEHLRPILPTLTVVHGELARPEND